MDYKEEYQKALERAKQGLPLDEVFPELKGSEDERIRKELLEEIEFIIPHDDETDSEGLILPSYHARIDRYKSYLEKQKDQKWSPSEGEMSVLYKLCYIGNQITDEDDTDLTRLYQDLKREYFNGHSFENMFSREKQKEQKPESCDCSRDEESYTNGIHHVLMNPEAYGLIEQQPAEWSEEDEGMLNCIIATLCEESHGGRETNNKMVTWLENRLKSSRPQPHWKPSDVQMEALAWYSGNSGVPPTGDKAIKSLYNDLKKLM